ncbi:MAG: DUF4138 domain-containing protein [Bacteroidales bacterium]|jgi:hypothetical protein|nr:DUF4138 domain-containing protein [Bacteroidales bacterium]
MIQKTILAILLILASIKIFAQSDIGNIYISDKYTVTLMFAEPIEFVIWGNNPILSVKDGVPVNQNYEQFQKDKTLSIIAKRTGIDKSSITVKTTDGVVYYGFIINEVNEKLFYDFTDKLPVSAKKAIDAPIKQGDNSPTANSGTTGEQTPDSEIKSDQEYDQKLSLLMDKPTEYRDFGLVANNLVFSVTNIMNDKENMYLKVTINNKSGNTFVINSVVFKYVEGKTKGIKRKVVANEERLMPVFSKTVDTVAAYTLEQFGYVLPLYSTGSEGRFMIQFIEDKGTRNYQIEIPVKDMLKIKNF